MKIDLGPCDCPGTPHGTDWCEAKDRLSYGDLRRIGGAQLETGEAGWGLAQVTLLLRAIRTWSKTDLQGRPVPVTIESIDDLDPDQARVLVRMLDNPTFYMGGTLPPVNGEPSPAGSGDSPPSTS